MEKDDFSFSLQTGTQRAGKVKFLCKAHKKVMLELEEILLLIIIIW